MIKAGHQKMYRKEEQLMEMTLRWYGSDYDTVTLEQNKDTTTKTDLPKQ